MKKQANFVALVVALLAIAACDQYQTGNHVEVRLSSAYSPDLQSQWQVKVAEASGIWRQALGTDCIDPFPLDGGDSPNLVVTLYAPEEWRKPGALGFTPTPDDIQVKGPRPGNELGLMVDIVLHEMGHSMGLEHDLDPTSIMNPDNTNIVPNQHDILVARQNLGCDTVQRVIQ